MAKQQSTSAKSYYTGPNRSLVEGAGLVGATQNQAVGVDLSAQFTAMSAGLQANRTQAAIRKEASQKKANEAYSAISNMDFDGVMPSMQAGVQDALMPLARQSADLKLQMGQISDPQQKALMQAEVNKIDSQIKTFTSQVKDLTTNSKEQLDFHRGSDRSDANDPDYVDTVTSIYSGTEAPMLVNGQLAFNINGEIVPYSSLQDVKPKAYKEMTSYTESLGNAEGAQEPLGPQKVNAYRTKMIETITQDNIASLGMDDFGAGTGGLVEDKYKTMQEWQSYVQEDYAGAKEFLASRMTDHYVSTADRAATKYKAKQAQENAAKNGGKAYDGFANYGGVPTHVASGLTTSDKEAINYTLNNKDAKDGTVKIIMPGSTVATEQRLHKSKADNEWYFMSKTGDMVPYSEVQKYHPTMLDPYTPVDLSNLGAGEKNEEGKGNEGFGRNG